MNLVVPTSCETRPYNVICHDGALLVFHMWPEKKLKSTCYYQGKEHPGKTSLDKTIFLLFSQYVSKTLLGKKKIVIKN